MPYESGMDPIHDTRRRFAVRFHLVAIAFLVFDVELLFLYPWAVATRHTAVGAVADGAAPRPMAESIWPSVNIGLKAAVWFSPGRWCLCCWCLGFAYDWRKGIFRWR